MPRSDRIVPAADEPHVLLFLALAPLAARADTLVQATALGVVVALGLAVSAVATVMIRRGPFGPFAPAAIAVAIAASIAALTMLARIGLPGLDTETRAAIPLVAPAAAWLAWTHALARVDRPMRAAHDAIVTGIAALGVLVVIAALREALGGTGLARHPAGAYLALAAAYAAYRATTTRARTTA